MGSGSSVQLAEGSHIVVIGGGYGGLLLAHLLHKKQLCRVTLIDPKDCMVHYVAALRSSVIPDYAKKMFIPYDQVLGESFVRGKVVSVDTDERKVKLESGTEIDYTELVIATGATSPFPGKIIDKKADVSATEGIEFYKDFHNEISKSKKILIVGGGAVGLEMAGELRNEFPECELTVVNSREYLISNRLAKNFQDRLMTTLEKLKINLLLSDKVNNMDELELNKHKPGQTATTTEGKTIEVDMIISCVGNKLQTDFLQETLGTAISDNGVISVDEQFKVEGFDDVYAIGDVTNINEEKMAYTAKLHAKFLVQNFVLRANGKELKSYKPGELIMVLPLGRTGGISSLKGVILGDTLTKMLKSKTLFTPPTWSDVGLKAP